MYEDVGPILKKWKYVENDLNVRIIDGLDGKQKLQMRLDLGILQMELDGRPDGRKPHRFDSYLSYFENKLLRLKKSEFVLSTTDCFKLQQEAIQFYHRYLALMKLDDYTRVARDTSHNLRLFDFVNKFAQHDEIIWSFEQYRAYVIMMNIRARASMSLEKSNFDEALQTIKDGIADIEKFYNKNEDKLSDEKYELDFLRKWLEEIQHKKPVTKKERLTKELEKAVKGEEYERAAILRDQLQNLVKGKSRLRRAFRPDRKE